MTKLKIVLVVLVLAGFLLFGKAHAATILFPTGGGTGKGTFSPGILGASGTNPFFTTASTSLTGTGPISFSNPVSVLGSLASIISCATASGSQAGCLSSADWSTFNGKQAALAFTYPLVNTANTVSLAFGTTTSNTWGGTQTFSSTPVLGSLTGLVKAASGVLSAAVNGTDFTLITANTCSAGQHVSDITAAGIITCSADSGGAGGSISTSTPLAAGQVDFSTGVNTIGNDSSFFWDNTNKRLGIGSSTPQYPLVVSGRGYFGNDGLPSGSLGTVFNTYTTDLNSNVIANSFQASGAVNAAGNVQSVQFNVADTGANNVATLTGLNGLAAKNGSGTVTTLTGIQASARISGTTVATTLNGFVSQTRVLTGTSATTVNNFNASAGTVSGTITSSYGFHAAAQKISGVTTGYGFASDGASDLNYFLGNTGIGTTTPSQRLSVQGNALFSGDLALANLTATGTITAAAFNRSGTSDGCAQWASNLLTSTGVACGAGSGGVATSTNEVANQIAVFSSNSATPALIAGYSGFNWNNTNTTLNITGNASTTGTVEAGGAGGVEAYGMGSGVGTLGFNSLGYVAGVAGYGALFQLAPSTGAFTAFLESNVAAGAPHAHTQVWGWDNAGKFSVSNAFAVGGNSVFTGTVGIGTSTPATTLGVQGDGLFSGNLSVAGLTATGTVKIAALSGVLKATSGTVAVASNGTDYTLVSANTCTNQVFTAATAAGVFTCSTVSNAMLANSTISGVALGGSLFAHTHDSTLTGTSYNGSAAVSDWGLNLTSANTWTGQQTFNTSAPIFGTLNGLVQGNGSSAATAIGGTIGQIPYYSGTNTVLATSTVFIDSTGNVGIGSTTPGSLFSIGNPNGINFSTATSTFSSTGGINLTNGCYAVGGVCIGSGGASLTGTTGQIDYFSGTNTAVGTSTVFIGANSFVGIGTTSPQGQLTVHSGQLTVPRGAGSSPGIAFNDDLNLGIFSLAPDVLDFATNGTNRLQIANTGIQAVVDLSSGSSRSFYLETSTGTASAPAYEFQGDFNTGIWSSAGDFINFSTNGTDRVAIDSVGRVGIGSSTPWRTLDVNGTVGFKGLTTSSGLQQAILCQSANNEVIAESVACVASAKRYKENIENLDVGLDELMKLRPVSFTWKKDYLGNNTTDPNQSGIQYSLIADEVQNIDPRLVSITTQETEFEGKKYPAGSVNGLADMNHWVALLVKSIQEVASKNDAQDAEIATLKAEIEELRAGKTQPMMMCYE